MPPTYDKEEAKKNWRTGKPTMSTLDETVLGYNQASQDTEGQTGYWTKEEGLGLYKT